MLSFQTILPDTMELLKTLMLLPELKEYPDGSEYRALLSMAYFGDADSLPMPYMFENVDWEIVKQHIRNEVDAYNQRSLSKQ